MYPGRKIGSFKSLVRQLYDDVLVTLALEGFTQRHQDSKN